MTIVPAPSDTPPVRVRTLRGALVSLISRKFLIAFFAQGANVGLVAFKLIDAGVYATCTALIVGGYMTSNVVQKATQKDQILVDE